MIETAERRMFAKTIIDSDEFLDMPLSAQSLYFHLSMRADDDGFVNSPKRIQRMIGASEDDMKLLIAKSFVLIFDTGIIVIKHWRINNYIQNDRYKPTLYTDERSMLALKENNEYVFESECIHDGYIADTQYRLGKDSKGKDSKGESKRFSPPTPDDVSAYALEKGYVIDAEAFCDFYTSKGWKVGKDSMKDWQAAVRNWVRRDKEDGKTPQASKPKPPQTGGMQQNNPFQNYEQHQYTDEDFEAMERAMMGRRV